MAFHVFVARVIVDVDLVVVVVVVAVSATPRMLPWVCDDRDWLKGEVGWQWYGKD